MRIAHQPLTTKFVQYIWCLTSAPMGIKGHKPEEIVTKLRQVEVLVGHGVARIDAIKEVQITK